MSAKVLIVDDSATIRAGLATAVRAMRLEPILAENGEKGLELMAAEAPGIVLLDVNMPGIDGYETARRMRAALSEVWVPIIFLSSSEYDQDLERAIESGGDDYLVKPVSPVVLTAKIRALQRLDKMHQRLASLSKELTEANQRLETLAQQDGLTGVANRRAFDHRILLHFALAARQKQPLSLALCDVDHFKAYNDHYGHPAGDECLRKISSALARSCKRTTDLVARYGGEEFVLLLPDTPPDGVRMVMEAAQREVAGLAIPHASSQVAGIVTFSAGLVTYAPERDLHADDLIKRADEALYRAKHLGRNRTISA
jgi:diguanylate cyclase (GGDEF)-like protein